MTRWNVIEFERELAERPLRIDDKGHMRARYVRAEKVRLIPCFYPRLGGELWWVSGTAFFPSGQYSGHLAANLCFTLDAFTHEVIGSHTVWIAEGIPNRVLAAADECLHHEIRFGHTVFPFEGCSWGNTACAAGLESIGSVKRSIVC